MIKKDLLSRVLLLLFACCIGVVGQNPVSSVVLSGHSGGISGVAFSVDGKTLISVGGRDKDNVKIWDVTSATLKKTINCDCLASGVAINPKGTEIVVAGTVNIPVFDLASSESVMELGGTMAMADKVLYSPDGNIIVSASLGTIRIWNSLNGKEIGKIAADAEKVSSIAMSPDGKTLASGGWDKTVRLWDMVTGKEIKKLVGHIGWVTSLAFSSDGKLLASGDQDTSLRIWDTTSGKSVQVVEDENLMGSSIDTIAFAPSSLVPAEQTVIAGNLGSLVFLSAATGRWKQSRVKSIISAMAFSPDGNYVALGSSDKSLTLLEIKTKKETALTSK